MADSYKVENGRLKIDVALSTGTPSKTGKSLIVAGTGGFIKAEGEHNGKTVRVSLNAIV